MKATCRIIPSLLACLLALAGCDDGSRSEVVPPDLVIHRSAAPETVTHEDGTVTRQFSMGVKSLMSLSTRVGRPDDPFGGSHEVEPPDDIRDLPLQLFKRLGIGFPEGTTAAYDRESETLTVRQTTDWMDQIESLLELVSRPEVSLTLRVEIYEVPAALALRLEQSASDQPEHTAEWQALREIVAGGDAEFVTSCNLQTRSGQRSKVAAAEKLTVFAGFETQAGEESLTFTPVFVEREVGTIAEMDAVLDPDNEFIDLNLFVEHHTAPPDFSKVEIPLPGSSERTEVELPAFHAKSITTQITIRSGDTKLLTSWRPTGKPEFEKKDVMRIVFIRGDVKKVSSD